MFLFFGHLNSSTQRQKRGKFSSGFTLIELLVVITIIGLMAVLSMPALKGFGQGNLINSVSRQLTDDINYARTRAISDRCNVYVVFVTTNIYWDWKNNILQTGLNEARSFLPAIEQARFLNQSWTMWTNLVQQQYTAYAIYADRTVGDQPSQKNPRYLSEWKSLPDGVMFHPYKLTNAYSLSDWMQMKTNHTSGANIEAPLVQMTFRFPTAKGPELQFPCIAFNHRGELSFPYLPLGSTTPTYASVPVEYNYETLPLIKATAFYFTTVEPVLEYNDNSITPPTALYNDPLMRVRIDGKTGKVTIPKNEFQ